MQLMESDEKCNSSLQMSLVLLAEPLMESYIVKE